MNICSMLFRFLHWCLNIHVVLQSHIHLLVKIYSTLFILHILICLYGDAPLSLKNVILTALLENSAITGMVDLSTQMKELLV